jgi:hypothetical protein
VVVGKRLVMLGASDAVVESEHQLPGTDAVPLLEADADDASGDLRTQRDRLVRAQAADREQLAHQRPTADQLRLRADRSRPGAVAAGFSFRTGLHRQHAAQQPGAERRRIHSVWASPQLSPGMGMGTGM